MNKDLSLLWFLRQAYNVPSHLSRQDSLDLLFKDRPSLRKVERDGSFRVAVTEAETVKNKKLGFQPGKKVEKQSRKSWNPDKDKIARAARAHTLAQEMAMTRAANRRAKGDKNAGAPQTQVVAPSNLVRENKTPTRLPPPSQEDSVATPSRTSHRASLLYTGPDNAVAMPSTSSQMPSTPARARPIRPLPKRSNATPRPPPAIIDGATMRNGQGVMLPPTQIPATPARRTSLIASGASQFRADATGMTAIASLHSQRPSLLNDNGRTPGIPMTQVPSTSGEQQGTLVAEEGEITHIAQDPRRSLRMSLLSGPMFSLVGQSARYCALPRLSRLISSSSWLLFLFFW